MKRKIFVTTKKIMSQHILEAEENEKLVAKKLGVTTQDSPVKIRTRLLHQNSVAKLSKIYRNRIQERKA